MSALFSCWDRGDKHEYLILQELADSQTCKHSWGCTSSSSTSYVFFSCWIGRSMSGISHCWQARVYPSQRNILIFLSELVAVKASVWVTWLKSASIFSYTWRCFLGAWWQRRYGSLVYLRPLLGRRVATWHKRLSSVFLTLAVLARAWWTLRYNIHGLFQLPGRRVACKEYWVMWYMMNRDEERGREERRKKRQ